MTTTSTEVIRGSSSSLAAKAPCVAATTANITLYGEQTVDGVACVTGNRVLVKIQTSSVDNGIYIVDTGTWSRAPDCNGANDIVKATFVVISGGTTNVNTSWGVSSANPITIGTSAITFVQNNTTLAGVSAYMQTLLPATTAAAARALLFSQRQPCVTMIRTANSTNDTVTSAAWKVYDETGAEVSTAGTTTEGLQEAINYAAQYGYDLEVFGGGIKAAHWGVPYGGALGNNPFTTTFNSATVSVSHAAHGKTTGDKITFNGLSGAINNIPTSEFAAEHALTFVNANSYTVAMTTLANATGSGGGANCRWQDSGQDVAIISCSTGITIPPIQGVMWKIHATINFGGASTEAIVFDSVMSSTVEFYDQIVCSGTYTGGVVFRPTNELPQDPNGPVVGSSRFVITSVVVLNAGCSCVYMDTTNGDIADNEFRLIETNGGYIGVFVNMAATHGYRGNICCLVGAHDHAGSSVAVGSSITGAANTVGNQWMLTCHPAAGAVGVSSYGIGDIYNVTIDSTSGVPLQGIRLEASATGNIFVVSTNTATTPFVDGATVKDNVYISGGAVASGAATYTLGANFVETRAAGAAAAGAVNNRSYVTTFTGDAGGTSDVRSFQHTITGSGANAVAAESAARLVANWNGSVTLNSLQGTKAIIAVNSTGSATNAIGFSSRTDLVSSGNVTNAYGLNVEAPTLSSSGVISNNVGVTVSNIGHATLVTNAISFRATATTAAATLTAAFQGSNAAGATRYNLYMDGLAQNYLNGPLQTTKYFRAAAPRTITAATDSPSDVDTDLICNRAGTVTLTLPAAASYAGRELYVRTITANTVVSAASDVVPLAGGAAATAILPGTAGRWARLVSDGTSWQIMAAA